MIASDHPLDSLKTLFLFVRRSARMKCIVRNTIHSRLYMHGVGAAVRSPLRAILETPIQDAIRSFVREHNVRFLKRVLKVEADPDDRRVFRRASLISKFGLSAFTSEDRDKVQRAWHALNAWPDFPPALVRLRRRYVAASFTILSTSLIVDVSRHNGLNWDCVVSCEMIGSYKPNPESYATCARWLGYSPEEILMVASHNFDLLAARKVGFHTAFIRRPDEWGAAGPPDPTP
jgi:2-haloalkanoic acid dehalogenase type II